jgi:tetratricopeptide (TPR) repeat protein
LAVLLAGLSLLLAPVWGQPAEPVVPAASQLSLGDAYYRSGQFAKARDAYRQALVTGPVTVPLLYNLAGAHFRVGEVGWAIVYYQRAQLAAPRDRDLRANLETALATRRSPATTAVPGWGEVALGYLLARVTLNELTVAGVLCYLVAAALGWVWLRRGQLRRRLRWVLWVGVGLTLVLGALAGGKWQAYHDPSQVVVVAGSALRSGPAGSFPALRQVNQGERGRRVDGEGVWQEVILESGTRGFLPQTAVEPVVPGQRPAWAGVRVGQ